MAAYSLELPQTSQLSNQPKTAIIDELTYRYRNITTIIVIVSSIAF